MDNAQSKPNGSIPEGFSPALASTSSPVLQLHSGLYQLGLERALSSGTTEPREADVTSLTEHAIAMAQEAFRQKFDPSVHYDHKLHQDEIDRLVAERAVSKDTEQYAEARLRDAEAKRATIKPAGDRPEPSPLGLAIGAGALAMSISPTLRDVFFITIPDPYLSWFCAAFIGSVVAGAVEWTIFARRYGLLHRLGLIGGVGVGVAMGIVRLSAASSPFAVVFAIGMTLFEIAVVIAMERVAANLTAGQDEWEARDTEEKLAEKAVTTAHDNRERARKNTVDLQAALDGKINLVQDINLRNQNIEELKQACVKSVLDGYNAGVARNRGIVRGVGGVQ